MKAFKVLLLALVCAVSLPSKADEGMWLLQMMQEMFPEGENPMNNIFNSKR